MRVNAETHTHFYTHKCRVLLKQLRERPLACPPAPPSCERGEHEDRSARQQQQQTKETAETATIEIKARSSVRCFLFVIWGWR